MIVPAEDLRRVVRQGGEEEAPPGTSLPPWATALRDALLATSPAEGHEAVGRHRRFLDAADPLPFEDAFVPMVVHASERLAAEAGPAARTLGDAAFGALERHLLVALTGVSALTLYERLLGEEASGGGYRGHVEGLLAGDFLPLLSRHAVLGRALGTLLHTWIASNAALLRRLDADSDLLGRVLGDGRGPGRLIALLPGLSDRHGGGGTVTSLTFSSGLEVVYKPRELAMEGAFNRLLAWLDSAGCDPGLRVLRVLDRGTYGWMERARHEPCSDAASVARYYRRTGMLLCVAHVLGARDLHFGNVVAAGEHPVLVDTEALLHPGRSRTGGGDPGREHGSVLETGLLPELEAGPEGAVHDRGGAGRPGGGLTPFRVALWTDVNTAAMTLRPARVPVPALPHVPVLRDAPADPGEHVDDLVHGFRSMYGLILRSREQLLSPDGPLEAFVSVRGRVLARHTRTYARALESALRPRFLRTAAEHRAELRRCLAADAGGEGEGLVPPGLTRRELDDLERLDVPRFTAPTDGLRVVAASGEAVDLPLAEAGIAGVRRRLGAMSPAGVETQVGLIRAAYALGAVASALDDGEPTRLPLPAALALEAGDRLFPFGPPRG